MVKQLFLLRWHWLQDHQQWMTCFISTASKMYSWPGEREEGIASFVQDVWGPRILLWLKDLCVEGKKTKPFSGFIQYLYVMT